MSPAAPAAAASAEPPPVRALAAPWCGTSIWTGGKMPTSALTRSLERVEKVIDTIDVATDAATVVLLAVSGGVAVPVGVAKAVAKLGARMIIRVVKRLKSDVAKVNKRRAGVRLKLKCVGGVVPYPSLGVYT
jgi:uncharacterized phosphosugar-binding protein